MNDDHDNEQDDKAIIDKLTLVLGILNEKPKTGVEGLREVCGLDPVARLRYAVGSLCGMLEAVGHNLIIDQIEGKQPAPETLPVVTSTIRRTLAIIEGDYETALAEHKIGEEHAAMHDATKNSKVGVGNC